MAYILGALLAVAVARFASSVGFDRDRSFYPTVLVVVASSYALFAVLGSDPRVLATEAIPILAFVLLALLGFRRSNWFVVAGLFGHGVFDLVHAAAIHNDGVPRWWPGFCLAYDVVAGLCLAGILVRARVPVNP